MLMRERIRPFRSTWDQVLSGADDLRRLDMICCAGPPITGAEGCLIYDSDLLPEEVDTPQEALDLGYRICLISGQIQEVLQNARLQILAPNRPTVYKAMRYFIENDAFGDLTS